MEVPGSPRRMRGPGGRQRSHFSETEEAGGPHATYRPLPALTHPRQDFEEPDDADPDAEGVQSEAVVGDVSGRTAIIVDDVIDKAAAFTAAASMLEVGSRVSSPRLNGHRLIRRPQAAGATRVLLMVAHGVLSGSACEEIEACPSIERLYVTNTLPQEDNMKRCPKIRMIDCSAVLAEAVRRIHNDESMSHLHKSEEGVGGFGGGGLDDSFM